jgi:hypothetical protein
MPKAAVYEDDKTPTEERDALARLLGDSDLLGMARFLLPDRAQALADRARLMLQRGEVLRPGEF